MMRFGLLTLAAGAALAIAYVAVPATDAKAAEFGNAGRMAETMSQQNVILAHGWHRRCRWGRLGLHRHNRWGRRIPCGPGWGWSDMRLKHDITRLATLDDGIGLYQYSFNGETEKHIGVMAQEVIETAPNAVLRDESGYYLVNYDVLFADPEMRAALDRSGYKLAP